MSKSLGNFLTIRDALKSYLPEVLRLFLLSQHYRSPLDFSKTAVLALQTGLVRIYRTLQRLEMLVGEYQGEKEAPSSGFLATEQKDPFLKEFVQAMDDDLNSAGALAAMFEKVKAMNKLMDAYGDKPDEGILNQLKDDRRHLFSVAAILGLLEENPEGFFKKLSRYADSIDADEVKNLIEERAKARADMDWAKADAARDRLQEMGIVLEDGPDGTTWRFQV
jgi:cysteinyl-tRNA synthetase